MEKRAWIEKELQLNTLNKLGYYIVICIFVKTIKALISPKNSLLIVIATLLNHTVGYIQISTNMTQT